MESHICQRKAMPVIERFSPSLSARSLIALISFSAAMSEPSWVKPRARPTPVVFGDLSFLGPQKSSWLSSGRLRQLREQASLNGTSSRVEDLPRWNLHTHSGEETTSDGRRLTFAASARPLRRWTAVMSADIDTGVSSVACVFNGGASVDVIVEGSKKTIFAWAAAVQDSSSMGGAVLLIGSGAWGCHGNHPWYISTSTVLTRNGDVARFVGRQLDLHEAFEDLHFSISLTPSFDKDNANATGNGTQSDSKTHEDGLARKLADRTFSDSVGASTSYGFNWNFDADKPLKEVLSLIDVGTGVSSSAGDASLTSGLTAECIECFVRAVAGIDIRYSFNLFSGQPRIYVSLGGNAELHGWLEVVATVEAESTWDRLLAHFELPTITFYVYIFPVVLKPFTSLRSSLTITGGRMIGSIRGGVGARGSVRGRIELNTDGWDDLPPDRIGKGVKGLRTGLDIEFAQRVVMPSFAFQADDLQVRLRLIPSVGIKFYNSFSVVMNVAGTLGAQIVDRDAPFDFTSTRADISGSFYALPEQIENLKVDAVKGWDEFGVNITVLSETAEFRPSPNHVFSLTSVAPPASGSFQVDFNTSDLSPTAYVRFRTTSSRKNLGPLSVRARVYEKRNAPSPPIILEGTARCFTNCDELPRSGGDMLVCGCGLQLDSESDTEVGRLNIAMFWVPDGTQFVPPLRSLFFTHPLSAEDSLQAGAQPVVWGAGDRCEIKFILDPATVRRNGDLADPPIRLSASRVSDGSPIEMRPGQAEIDIESLTGAWDLTDMIVPENYGSGALKITAIWTDQASTQQSKSVVVAVKPRSDADFEITSLDPATTNKIMAFEDIEVRWRLQPGLSGRVHLTTRDSLTKEIVYERQDLNAATRVARINWLSLRGASASSRDVLLTAEFRNDMFPGSPISLVREVSITAPVRATRRMGSIADFYSTNSTPRLRNRMRHTSRQLSTLEDIRESMFGNCEPDNKYAMFGAVDVGASLHIDGSCKKDAACPDSEILGGYLSLVAPAVLNCEIGGKNFCQGNFYTCRNNKIMPLNQPVISLKLARQFDTSPFEAQLNFFRKRIATALSVLSSDISLDTSALQASVPELIFRLTGPANFKLSKELVQAAVDAGLLSFDDAALIQPVGNTVAANSDSRGRLLNTAPQCSSIPLAGSLGRPAFVVDLGHPCSLDYNSDTFGEMALREARRLRSSMDGLTIVGVEEQTPTMYAIRHPTSSGLLSVGLTNIVTIWVVVVSFFVGCLACWKLLIVQFGTQDQSEAQSKLEGSSLSSAGGPTAQILGHLSSSQSRSNSGLQHNSDDSEAKHGIQNPRAADVNEHNPLLQIVASDALADPGRTRVDSGADSGATMGDSGAARVNSGAARKPPLEGELKIFQADSVLPITVGDPLADPLETFQALRDWIRTRRHAGDLEDIWSSLDLERCRSIIVFLQTLPNDKQMFRDQAAETLQWLPVREGSIERRIKAEEEKSKLIKQLQSQLDAYDRERAR